MPVYDFYHETIIDFQFDITAVSEMAIENYLIFIWPLSLALVISMVVIPVMARLGSWLCLTDQPDPRTVYAAPTSCIGGSDL